MPASLERQALQVAGPGAPPGTVGKRPASPRCKWTAGRLAGSIQCVVDTACVLTPCSIFRRKGRGRLSIGGKPHKSLSAVLKNPKRIPRTWKRSRSSCGTHKDTDRRQEGGSPGWLDVHRRGRFARGQFPNRGQGPGPRSSVAQVGRVLGVATAFVASARM